MLAMTWRNNSSSMTLRKAAMLFLPGGGKTPGNREAVRSRYSVGSFGGRPFGCLWSITLPQGQVRVSQHHQRHMTVKPRPQAPLIVIKPEFSFGVLIEALNDPTDMSQIDQFRQGELTQSPGKVIFPLLGLVGFANGPLTEKQPTHRQVFASVPTAKHLNQGKLLDQGTFGPVSPGYPGPCLGGELSDKGASLAGSDSI